MMKSAQITRPVAKATRSPRPAADPLRQQPVLVDVHSLHKSGTMFLFHFFRHLAHIQAAKLISENNTPADAYGPVTQSQFQDSCDGEPCQLMFRAPIRSFKLDEYQVDEAIACHRIFHVRDPRDILVSEYFSFGWIHPTEDTGLDSRREAIQQLTIDQYVIDQSEQSAWPLEKKFAPLLEHSIDPKTEAIVKYEQMVTEFPRWCHRVLRAAGLKRASWLTARLAWKYRHEFKTDGERMAHKRRITPGDFRDKLKPETIRILNRRFKTVLERFDYAT